MIIRKIRQTELKRCNELSALCFASPMEKADLSPEEYARDVLTNPRSRESMQWENRWAAFEDDDKTMMASFAVVPWNANLDGHEVSMGSISSVTTLPQYRRCGAIRACFEEALVDMHRNGMVLSYLYPFSNSFYRRFGYEPACDVVKWRLRLEGMPMPALAGSWELCEPDNPRLADIRAVDAVRQRRYNCMVIAGEMEYLWLAENPYVTMESTYVYYDGSGIPRSYMSVKAVPGQDLTCKRFVFNDREGFLGLLGLLKRFQSRSTTHVSLILPTDVDLQGLLPEYRCGNVERTVQQCIMARVINVEAALHNAKMRGSGTLRIAVSDGFISENNAVFELRFAPGRDNEIHRTSAMPDIELNIGDFSRLLLGGCALDPEWIPGLKLNCSSEAVSQVFYRKPVFISQYF